MRSDHNTCRVTGAILGLALGDAFGAPYEGGVLERVLWRVIGTRKGKRRWTDDTQMSIAIMRSLMACGGIDQNDLAARFAASYRWSRGYGPGAARVLKRIGRGEAWESASRAVYPEGSYGNGGAMRSPAVGLFFVRQGLDAVSGAAEAAAAVTHAHPLAKEGAVLIALATALAFKGVGPPEIMMQLLRRVPSGAHSKRLRLAAAWLSGGDDVHPRDAAARLGNGMAAVASCTTAVYAAMRFMAGGFDDLLGYVIQLGGDVDTISAMAGAIWGAARGLVALPEEKLDLLDDRDALLRLAQAFAETIHGRGE